MYKTVWLHTLLFVHQIHYCVILHLTISQSFNIIQRIVVENQTEIFSRYFVDINNLVLYITYGVSRLSIQEYCLVSTFDPDVDAL